MDVPSNLFNQIRVKHILYLIHLIFFWNNKTICLKNFTLKLIELLIFEKFRKIYF